MVKNAIAVGLALAATIGLHARERDALATSEGDGLSVNLEVFTPESGNLAGAGSRACLVDLKAEFNGNLATTGASPELTGPGAHNNAAPLPGSFGNGANLDHFAGLVVLLSSSRTGARLGASWM